MSEMPQYNQPVSPAEIAGIQPKHRIEHIVPITETPIPDALKDVMAPEEKPLIVVDNIHFNTPLVADAKFNNGAAIGFRNRIRQEIGVDFRNTQALARLIGEVETNFGIEITADSIDTNLASILYLLALTSNRTYIPNGVSLISDQVYSSTNLAIDWNPSNGDLGFGFSNSTFEVTERGAVQTGIVFTIGDL